MHHGRGRADDARAAAEEDARQRGAAARDGHAVEPELVRGAQAAHHRRRPRRPRQPDHHPVLGLGRPRRRRGRRRPAAQLPRPLPVHRVPKRHWSAQVRRVFVFQVFTHVWIKIN